METQRIFLAIALSLAILLGYQYFFVPPPPPVSEVSSPEASGPAPATVAQPMPVSGLLAAPVPASAERAGKDVVVETSLYRAVISENGGVIKSFQLREYREALAQDSGAKELVRTNPAEGLPLNFTWGAEPGAVAPVLYEAEAEQVRVGRGGDAELVMRGRLANGVEIVRSMRFDDQQYLMRLSFEVRNPGEAPLQGAPYLALHNRPFVKGNQFVFSGPAVLLDGVLEEVDPSDVKKEGGRSFTGRVGWAAYEDNYFLCGIVPETGAQHTAHFAVAPDDRVATVLAGAADIIPPGGSQQYSYSFYFGPKRLSSLRDAGHELDRSVNFGWFDFMAKPTLYLLNFFHGYVGNYGVAIILVTVLIKLLFWPIAQKGMKSMKTMQKLQPKMAKIREKYQDDKQRQQQEMIKLYQTYKVNPVGGCLPMLIQIPVFFALYKVLLMTIELRHAPFLLWINDLAAPDRLFIGVDIPFLGGIPVLTLLMGASMFLQQKMTPATGDPTQQKVMMFMPLIFTFMFLNFASCLVLYWFVNNLLSIAQQYLINRQAD